MQAAKLRHFTYCADGIRMICLCVKRSLGVLCAVPFPLHHPPNNGGLFLTLEIGHLSTQVKEDSS